MSYDNFNFDRKKILKHCATKKTKDQKIEYLKNVQIDYLDANRDKDHKNIFCDVCEDIARPECGADDQFIIWIYNEIQRLKNQRDKYKRRIARIDKIDPKGIYTFAAIAPLVACTPRNILNWIKGVIIGKGKKLSLKTTIYKGKDHIFGQDMIDFLNKWNEYKNNFGN